MADSKFCYDTLKKILFCLNPEVAHGVTLSLLQVAYRLGLTKCVKPILNPVDVMGLHFSNRVGLSAGLDKNGDYIDALASLGFGFIEVGTVTPKPQGGNPKPRLFRLVEQEALVNRMGFNNKGVDYLVEKLKRIKYKGILGVNIGKNRDTSDEKTIEDYLVCFNRVLPYASYVTINISSPNTPGLRDLQQGEKLQELLHALKVEQSRHRYVPLVVKISPDLAREQLIEMAEIFLKEKIDGVIATNTLKTDAGGLSGKPLASHSTETIKVLHEVLRDTIPIIGCGGIFSGQDAREKRDAGAELLQVYTGLVYRGAGIIRDVAA